MSTLSAAAARPEQCLATRLAACDRCRPTAEGTVGRRRRPRRDRRARAIAAGPVRPTGRVGRSAGRTTARWLRSRPRCQRGRDDRSEPPPNDPDGAGPADPTCPRAGRGRRRTGFWTYARSRPAEPAGVEDARPAWTRRHRGGRRRALGRPITPADLQPRVGLIEQAAADVAHGLPEPPTRRRTAATPTSRRWPDPPVQQPAAVHGVGSPHLSYANCDDARAKGAAPVYSAQPGYRAGLDSDNDGIGCEDETAYAVDAGDGPDDGTGSAGATPASSSSRMLRRGRAPDRPPAALLLAAGRRRVLSARPGGHSGRAVRPVRRGGH